MLIRPLRLASISLVFAGFAFARQAHAATDTYTFRDKLQSNEGGANGNVLASTFNGDTPVAATFVDTVIDANACANTPTVRGYSFPAFGGLKSANTAPVVAGESYTISMIVKFSPLRGGYTRLIDFSNSTLDDGIYVLNNGISFYPVGTFAPDSFADNRFSVMTITRDAATNVVSLFIGLTAAGTYTDVDKRYVPSAGNLIFFMDNTTGAAAISESSPGVVTFLRVSNTAIAPTDLAATIDAACQSVACGNGKIEGAEGCDDGNNVDGDGCSAACKVENGIACPGGADAGSSDGGDAGAQGGSSCAATVCDGTDSKCGYVNGASSTCSTANAKTICRSGACGSASLKCIPEGGCFVDDDCASKACDAPTFTCLNGSDGGIAPNDAGTYTPSDGGFGVTPGTSEATCTCDVGPRRTSVPAIALFGAFGLALGIRRRVRVRALRSEKRRASRTRR